MTFYAPRNIGPADQVLFDADGNAVGIQAAGSSSQPVLGFNPTTHAAIDSLVSKDGPGATSRRIVLFGDSHTENNQDLGSFSFSALTQTGGTATLVGVTSQSGQTIKIGRVAETGYFGAHQITIVGGAAQFPVPADTPSPSSSRPRGDGVGAYTGMLVQYSNRNASRAWLHLANYRAKGELFHVVQNAAYGGDTTWGMLERIDHPTWGVTPFAAEWVSVFGGINDLNAGVPASTVIANLRTIYDYLRGKNYSIIAITLCPVISGHPAYADATHAAGVMIVNDWIRQFSRSQPKMMLWDFASVITDPIASPLAGKANYVNASDWIHFTPRAAWDLSTLILDACHTMLPGVQNTLPSTVADSRAADASIKQLQLNPLFQGAAGSLLNVASGTVATDWQVSHTSAAASTAVCSVVARTVSDDGDALGNNQKVVLTINATNESGYVRNTASNAGQLVPGRWYYIEAAVRVKNWTGLNLPNLTFAFSVDGVTTGAASCQSASSSAWGPQPTGISEAMVHRSPPFYVPAGSLSAAYGGVSWISNAASASGEIYLGRCHVREIVSDDTVGV